MSTSDFRERAREMLRGKWGMAVLTTLVAGMLGGLVFSASGSVDFEIDQEIINYIPDFIVAYLKVAVGIGASLSLLAFILGGTVRLGYCKYLLKLHDDKPADIKDLFSEFDRFGDGFVLSLLTALYIFLWTLVFIIPGIVATFKYAMAPFILLENPGMKPGDAITESKELMDGHKMELFFLNLSFIGWVFLSILTLGIGDLWLQPYMNASYAAFYRNLRPFPAFAAPQNPAPEDGNPWEQLTPEVE